MRLVVCDHNFDLSGRQVWVERSKGDPFIPCPGCGKMIQLKIVRELGPNDIAVIRMDEPVIKNPPKDFSMLSLSQLPWARAEGKKPNRN